MKMRPKEQIEHRRVERDSTVEGSQSEKSQSEQYSLAKILGVWAAAALPMAALAWVVAPRLAGLLGGPVALPRAVIVSLTVGLVWQFVLVLLLVYRERGSVRWSVLKEALWLRAPRSPRTGRVGGWLWLVLIPAMLIFASEDFIPSFSPAIGHDFAAFAQSDAGAAFMSGNWGWYALIFVLVLFNTVLGEELLFRGLLLPRMQGAFGRWDWVANGVLFAVYHLHMPWTIPATLLDTFALSYPSRRYRSALIGIAVHSFQSVMILVLTLTLVLR
jgi:membrane protease YdiL (CAAX protease family)